MTILMMRSKPVGVFDSGVGGISVLKHIRAALPAEDLLYCADSRHAPYGNKTPEAIRERAIYLTNFLIAQGAKAIVVACNTATAAAIDILRERYSLPIIGMEPAVKPASAASKSGVIGVLATTGTLQSAQFAGLLEHYGQNVTVVTQACVGLVECVERGELEAESTKALIGSYLTPLIEANADAIVLGCTHYPFVRPLIEQIINEQHPQSAITLIDTGAAVARQLHRRLQEAGLLNEAQAEGKNSFWVNRQSNNEMLQTVEILAALWQGEGYVAPLPILAKYRAVESV